MTVSLNSIEQVICNETPSNVVSPQTRIGELTTLESVQYMTKQALPGEVDVKMLSMTVVKGCTHEVEQMETNCCSA